jgi:hypothetical protein
MERAPGEGFGDAVTWLYKAGCAIHNAAMPATTAPPPRRTTLARLAATLAFAAWAAVAWAVDETPPPHPPPRVPPTEVPLDFVTDRSDLSGAADVAAYYGLLDYVRRVDPAQLNAAAQQTLEQQWKSSEFADWPIDDFQFYYDLTRRPESYRGQPVPLFGHIRMHQVDHPQNEFGIDPVHIVYLFTDDSQHHPVRVVFTENPDQVPVGEEVVSGISTTGYFLKLYRYEDRDGKGRFMPLVIARSIHWTPPQRLSFTPWQKAGLAALVLALAVAFGWGARTMLRGDAGARQRERALLGEDQPPDFSALN